MSKHNQFNTFNQQLQPKKNFLKNPLVFIDGLNTDTKVFSGIGLLTLMILVGGVWLLSTQGAKEEAKLAKLLVGKEIPVQESPHVQGKEHAPYNSNPPTSGPMWNGTAGPGIKDKQIPDELLVHSLEHGAVILHYKPDLPKDQVEKIILAFNAALGKKIMIPRENLDVPIVLTSWGRLLKLKAVDEKTIKEFIETNNDRSPEKMAI